MNPYSRLFWAITALALSLCAEPSSPYPVELRDRDILSWQSDQSKTFQIWQSPDLMRFSNRGIRAQGQGKIEFKTADLSSEEAPRKAFFYVKEDLPSLSVDWRTKQSIGGVSTLDRRQYFNMHETLTTSNLDESQKRDLIENYGVSFGRGIGGFTWHMKTDEIHQTANKGVIDLDKLKAAGKKYRDYIAKKPLIKEYSYEVISSAHVSKLYPNDTTLEGFDPESVEASAEFMAQFLKHYFEDSFRPKYLEPFNEPIAHSNPQDFTVNGARVPIEDLFRFHNVSAQRVRALNPDVQVGGYAGAWPAYEYWNFGHWKNRTKRFIDLAGHNMDFYSLHLYDGKNAGALKKSQRAGSNANALLDLITSYSQHKHGLVKPLIISEYGRTQPDYQAQEYTPARDGEIINSINQLLFVLMERPDHVIKSVPFIVGKSKWVVSNTGRTYPWVLYRPVGELDSDQWEHSHLIKFYDLWKKVHGDRLQSESSDPDLQLQVFQAGREAFVCLNNLDEQTESVDLSEVSRSLPATSRIDLRRLYCPAGGTPVLSSTSLTEFPKTLSLRANETVVFELQFEEEPLVTREMDRRRYYSSAIISEIKSASPQRYRFTLPEKKAFGAVLHLGVSRAHRLGGKSLSPLPSRILVNGRDCHPLQDWPGGDQAGRDQYFGTLTIPIPPGLVSQTTEVEIHYAEDGGYLSTAILEVNTQAR